MKIIWSPLASQKLDQFAEFIARDNLPAAIAFVDEVERKALSLRAHPFKGRMIRVLNDEKKREQVIMENYLLVYEIQPDTIEILTIHHTRQNPKLSDK
jgi:toxin ParE1/3/4